MPYTATRPTLATQPTFSGTPSRVAAKSVDFRASFWNDGNAVGEERAILFVFGLLVSALSVFMILPAIVDFVDGNPEWSVFAWTTAISMFFGIALALGNAHSDIRLDQRHAFLLTAASWIGLSVVGALPFVIADTGMSFTDAFFETVSGLTTTGSTVMSDLDQLPRGILLWRALLQWVGGIGIIVMAVAILPFLNVGGMQLFRTESSDRSDKIMPKASAIATALVVVYGGLSAACAIFYWLGGMTPFEAIAHAMTTLSTGGYSTSDASIAHFASPAIEWTGTAFMLLGGLPFVLYIRMVQANRDWPWRTSQVGAMLAFVAISTACIAAWLSLEDGYAALDALRLAAFNVVSIVTTTGYATADYGTWGGFAVGLLFLLTVVGGCTGSTAGGIKIFRFQIAAMILRRHMRSLIYPHAVFVMTYDGKPLTDDIVRSVMIFIFTFVLTVIVIAVSLLGLGLDFVTAISGAATAVANVGPGFGPVIGPSGNFMSLSDPAKWLLAIGMLLGRLEFFTLLVVFMPSFWRT